MAQVKHSEFSKMVVQAVFQRDLTVLPASFYLGLGTGALPAKGAALSAVNEVNGSGYGRIELVAGLTDFPLLSQVLGDWKVTAALKQFAAAGDFSGSADFQFLCDVAAGTGGRLFASASIGEPFRLLALDSFDVTAEYLDR